MRVVRLVCVSCSKRKTVHLIGRQIATGEIYWQCMECQKAGEAIWGPHPKDPAALPGKRR